MLIWQTRLGYEIRTVGHNPVAAVYAGISPQRIIIIAMLISGGLAGLMAVNVLMGVQQRLVLDFTAGAGFVGIAVALMGRSHPVGIVLASILFGVLYQGGAELAFDKPEHHPRHDRGHPGPGDPVRRRARTDVQAAARGAVRPHVSPARRVPA